MPFAKGHDPDRARAARRTMIASRRYARVHARATLPAAVSLSHARLRYMEQGQAGDCWLHAPTQLAETVAGLRGYTRFPVCRRLTGWQGKLIDGDGGNPDDGGSGLSALTAMTAEKGVGLAHEDLCPYPTGDENQMRAVLGQRPPQNVFDDARATHLVMPVDVRDLDEAKTLIGSDVPTPVCIGVWCPDNWQDGQTFYSDFGGGEFGHEVLIWGYALAGVFDQTEWFEIDNWWGLIYPPLPPAKAAKVPGYVPVAADRTSSFWISRHCLDGLIAQGNAELASATDVLGLAGGDIEAVSSAVYL